MTNTHHLCVDLFIIGGGINGVGIARDASLRGLTVGLCDKGDLGGATSSASSQLIHGGLRYLEYGEFRLVRHALQERETLLKIAPHWVHPLRFVMPHQPNIRPLWQLRCGLWLYDHLAKRQSLAKSHIISLPDTHYAEPLSNQFTKACVYSDCWVDDARLVIGNAKAATQHRATILTRTRCVNAVRGQHDWQLTLLSDTTNSQITVHAKALINAAGPWVDRVQRDVIGLPTQHHLRLVKGSHIVLPRLYTGEQAYLLQTADKRVVFTIPRGQHTIVGTTDVVYHDNLESIHISQVEIDYLLNVLSGYFKQTVTAADIIHTYAGVRPLAAQTTQSISTNTRDHILELHAEDNQPALLTVFGGKITTYRHLAETALNQLKPHLPSMQPTTTAHCVLPGGDISQHDMPSFCQTMQHQYAWLPTHLLRLYCYRYGSDIHQLLLDCKQLTDLDQQIAPDLYARELHYLQQHEWAMTADDVLWRRTKLGLRYTQRDYDRVANWFTNK